MRLTAPGLVLLATIVPGYAQTMSGAASSVDISSPANTTSNNRLTTPPTVVAPGLAAAGVETCLGSTSGGLSLMGSGVTFGLTVPDEGCNIRLAARQLHAFGYPKAALALMCQDPRVAAAMVAAGEVCPRLPVELPRLTSKTAEAGADSLVGRAASFAPVDERPPDILPQVSDGGSPVLSPAEERWFALQGAR